MLPSQLQPPKRAPQAAPTKVDIPSTVKPAKEAEKVGVQEASYVYLHPVIGPLDATYRVLVRERKKLLLKIGATRMWVSVDRLMPHAGVKTLVCI